MSIVVAVHKGNRVVLACDSQQSMGSLLPGNDNLTGSKIHRIGRAYLASTGWGLYHNILHDFLKGQRVAPLESAEAVFAFFLSLWRSLHDRYTFVNNQCEEKNSPFGSLDATFIVASSGGIFGVSSNMTVSRFTKYHAIGSGAEVAFGALHALHGTGLRAEAIAKKAICAAMDHNVYCGGEVELRRVTVKER
jgi:ATP-dependent HslUV protease, peptidase subunit HslV